MDNSQYERAQVKVNRIEDVESVQQAIQAMGHQTFSLTDILTSMNNTSRMIQMILEGIGAISLLVAAIGITNTMNSRKPIHSKVQQRIYNAKRKH